ncbi:MAG: DUF177 domain-containing protein [Bacteroidales bacterium]
MGKKDQYVIPFSGLTTGKHYFDYLVDHEFFESIEYSEIHNGSMQVKVELDRQETMLTFNISFYGIVSIDCDRCLDPFDMPVEGNEVLFVKFGEDYHEESAEVIVIPRTEHRFDLRTILYEMILLSLPYKRIHPEDEDGNSQCDPEILNRLRELEPEKEIDPRWEGLKGINLDN